MQKPHFFRLCLENGCSSLLNCANSHGTAGKSIFGVCVFILEQPELLKCSCTFLWVSWRLFFGSRLLFLLFSVKMKTENCIWIQHHCCPKPWRSLHHVDIDSLSDDWHWRWFQPKKCKLGSVAPSDVATDSQLSSCVTWHTSAFSPYL